MSHFVHLHLHSEYSLADSLIRIKPLVKAIRNAGMPAGAVTDQNNLFALVKFYRAAQAEGIKPIIGVDVQFHHDSDSISRLVLLCQNDTGYRNLTRLVSRSYTEGQINGVPYLQSRWLNGATEGLIALSGGREGNIGQALLAGHSHQARQQLDNWNALFPKRFYLELQRTDRPQEEDYIHAAVELALKTGTPVVATNDVCFLKSDDFDAHEVRVCVHDGNILADQKRPQRYSSQQYLRTPAEMAKLFADIPEALENSWLIAQRCNLELTLGENFLPDFPLPAGQTKAEYFRNQARVGLEQRLATLFNNTSPDFAEQRHPYDKRLAHELDVIVQMGFPGYFLIVADFIQWAKDNNIPVGPGRGCLTKDALVYRLTSNGIETVSIDEIKVGDQVLTHKNTFNKVTELFSYDIEEDLLTIFTYYGDFLNNITLTQDHKIYLGDDQWKKAQAITTKDWLVVPIPKYEIKAIVAFDLLDYCNEGCVEEGKLVNIKDKTIEENLLQVNDWKETNLKQRYLKNSYYFRKFLGRWIGNGYIIAADEKKYREVSIIFRKNDNKGVNETLAFIEENGYNYSISKQNSIVHIDIQDNFLHAFFVKTFFKFEFNSKYIPKFLFCLQKSEILEILDGYIAAKGYVIGGRIKITTTSKRLAQEIRQLLFQIGIPASLRKEQRKLTVIPTLVLEDDIYVVNLPANGSIYNVPKERQHIYKIEAECIKLKVRAIKKRHKVKTTVYDFAVKDDNSYTTSNYVVHNSGAGSLVAYALNITDLDPIYYKLLFERFLNPERVSMPDFDIDFCIEGRDDVINYVAKRYGRERVSQIITFGSMAAKAAVRDVGRVLAHPHGFVDKIAKLIPFELGITLDKALEKEEALLSRYKQEEDVHALIDMARQLEGITRNPGKHAGGVVIAPTVLTDFSPLYCEQDSNDLMTQFDKGDVEAVGLVKFDFLGLRTLTIIKWALETINRFVDPPIDISKLSLNDSKTYSLLKRGDTTAVFQLESSGIKKLIKRLQPDCFEDIVALVALYRPGPLQSGMVEDFIERKHGRAKVEYPHPNLAPILKPTYGVIVYQEQVMQIAQVLAGYSLGGADLLRRSMGKKNPQEMAKQRSVFTEGAVARGVKENTATYIFDLMEKFAAYGFNRCLVGETLITDSSTGERLSLATIYHKKIKSIASLQDDWTIGTANIVHVMQNGVKPIFKLTTSLGKTIKATANHPFLTLHGWKKLEDLQVGERIASPKHLPIEGQKIWEDYKLIVLGWTIAEGNTCHSSGFNFYNKDTIAVDDFITAVTQFDNTEVNQTLRKERHDTWDVFVKSKPISAAKDKSGRPTIAKSGARLWLESLDLHNKKAAQKQFPAEVLQLNNKSLAVLLGRLWAGDGFIFGKSDAIPYFATSSKVLAKQLQHLLLRLKIVSNVKTKQFNYKEGRIGYTVNLLGRYSIENFVKIIGKHLVSRKQTLDELQQYLREIEPNLESLDTLPPEIKLDVRKAKEKSGLTWKEVEAKTGISHRDFIGDLKSYKKGFRRLTIQKLGEFFNDDWLKTIATANIFWERVKEIEAVGSEMTYDLEIENTHNFIANDIIVHNSHSAGYALLSYQTAWLKAHYPAAFMAAVLSADMDNTDKIVALIEECRAMKLKMLTPNINSCHYKFTVNGEQNQSIRYGLGAIKGAGEAAIEGIVAERTETGPFTDLFDFCRRIDLRKASRRVLEPLIKCGALDKLGPSRAVIMASLDGAIKLAELYSKDIASGQNDIFGSQQKLSEKEATPYVKNVREWSETEQLKGEKESLGIYLSGHPINPYLPELAQLSCVQLANLAPTERQQTVRIAGWVTELRTSISKQGSRMAFVTFDDSSAVAMVKILLAVMV
jgi:DNA polymerase III alpha subunit/intein/homing endonuclease